MSEFKIDEGLFKDRKLITETLVDCLMLDDMEAFRDVLISHLRVMKKTKLVQKSGIGRRTLYDLMDPEKEFNPRINTIGKILRAVGD